MDEAVHTRDAAASGSFPTPSLITELLLLPDGRILVHNLTPAFASLLSGLNPADEQMGARCATGASDDRPRTTTNN